jgi:hypothetical protein
MSPDVHEVELGLVEEKVIVQSRDFETRVECGTHRRIDFVFEHDGVAHHKRLRCRLVRRERRPGANAHKRRHVPLIDPDLADLEHALSKLQVCLAVRVVTPICCRRLTDCPH